MSKEVLNRELKNAGEDLDTILKNHERKLRHKFVNKQNQKLFPTAGGTDVETWDLPMLLTVTLTVFKKSLDDGDIQALKSIKYMRDEVYAHTHSSSLCVDEYDEIRTKIENALTSLSNGLSDNLKDDCTTIIHVCKEEAISPTLKAELTEQLEKTEDSFQAIMGKLRDNNELLCEMRKEIMDKLNKMSVIEDRCEKIIKVIDTDLTLSGAVNESNDIDFVEGIITTVINKAIKKVGNENDYPRIRSVVDNILKDIEQMPDVEILSAEHKCILLKFRCTTYNGILNLLMYLESRSFLDSLNDLDLALRSTLPNVSSQFRLDVTVTPESMKNLLDELRAKAMEATRNERTIRVPIKVKSAQGIGHIWSLFETGGATKRLNELSEAVFDELNTKITVTPSVNLQQVQAAIKEAEESRRAVKGDVYPPVGRRKLADQAKPDPPADLEVEKVSKGSVALKWNAGFDGGLPQQFKVRYKAAGGRQNLVDVQPPGSTYSTVHHLDPGTEYEFIVIAFNDVGQSADSNMVKTKTPTKPDPPADLEVEKVSKGSVALKWNAGLDGGLPQQFKVRYKAAGGRQNLVDVQPPGSTYSTVHHLDPGTEYEFIVIAFNDVGQSADSNMVKTKTPTKPDPPTGLQVDHVSLDSATLKWNVGWDGGRPQKFSIGYKSTANKQEYKHLDVHQSRDNTTFTVDGLRPGTEYEFFVMASNEIGVSEKSITVKAKTSNNPATWMKSPASVIVCNVVLNILITCTGILVGTTIGKPYQVKEMYDLVQRLDDIYKAVETVEWQQQTDKTTFSKKLEEYKVTLSQKDNTEFKRISNRMEEVSRDISTKADEKELKDARRNFEEKLYKIKDKFTTRVEDVQEELSARLKKLTVFTDDFNRTLSEYKTTFKKFEHGTNDKIQELNTLLTNLSLTVELDLKSMLTKVEDQVKAIEEAKLTADKLLGGLQGDVNRIIPNTFNKEALTMAFMVLIIFVFMLALWIYKVQNSLHAGGPGEHRDMNAKDVLQRIPRRVPLSNSICIVSFDEARQPAHEALVSSAFLTVGNIQTKYFVVRRHEHLLNMPKCKFYIMCTEFSERHVIIEEPGLGLGDLKRCTYETIQRYGAKMIILYTRDPGSRNLGDQLYNHKIHCVSAQPELSCLRDLGRFFSTYDELSATQKKALNDTVVKCLQ
ncbi:uncharacterized protein LOC123561137 [Mercenaria mercenaria]|uniref:uncharacterized protein LOC123561137 n=1 Tax=Mercenaria mercenaria TaxID=6596 RepID=UPI00234ED7E4|nr:uncharacterized protein LOC123561137 [Mercenaria mercenaria]